MLASARVLVLSPVFQYPRWVFEKFNELKSLGLNRFRQRFNTLDGSLRSSIVWNHARRPSGITPFQYPRWVFEKFNEDVAYNLADSVYSFNTLDGSLRSSIVPGLEVTVGVASFNTLDGSLRSSIEHC